MAKIFIPKKQNNPINIFASIIVQLCRADVEFCELNVFWYNMEDGDQSFASATRSYSDALKGNLAEWHVDMIRNRLAWLHCQVDCLSDEIYQSYDDQHSGASSSEVATFKVSPILDKESLTRNVAWLRLKIADLANVVWSNEDSQEHLGEVAMQYSQTVSKSKNQPPSFQPLAVTVGKAITALSSDSGDSGYPSNHKILERINAILEEEETLESIEQKLMRSPEQQEKLRLVDERDISKKIDEILPDDLFSPIQLLEKMKTGGQSSISSVELAYIGQRRETLSAEKKRLRAVLLNRPYE